MSYQEKLNRVKNMMGNRLQCNPGYVRDPRHPIIGSGHASAKLATPRWLAANDKLGLCV